MPRKPPPRPDPLSPHGIRMTVVAKLVRPEVLKQKGAWGRELATLKRLQRTMPDDRFWLELSPAEPLDSLMWFMGDFGKGALALEWRNYQFNVAMEREQYRSDESRLDSLSSDGMMESTDEEAKLPAPKPRETPLAWADSV